MEEPGGLPSMGSHRVGHDWSDLRAAAAAAAVTVAGAIGSHLYPQLQINITLSLQEGLDLGSEKPVSLATASWMGTEETKFSNYSLSAPPPTTTFQVEWKAHRGGQSGCLSISLPDCARDMLGTGNTMLKRSDCGWRLTYSITWAPRTRAEQSSRLIKSAGSRVCSPSLNPGPTTYWIT